MARPFGHLASHWLRYRTQSRLKRGGNAGQYAVEFPSRLLKGVRIDCERRNLAWRLAPEDLAQRLLFAVGAYEGPLIDWISGELRRDDTVVDCGAHVGLLATPLAARLEALGGGRVIAFEPAPDSAAALAHHVAINGLAHRVDIVEAALGEAPSRAALGAPGSGGDDPSQRSLHGSRDEGDGKAGRVEVDVVRLDDWWREAGRPKLDVLKMDVEGAELAALRGMATALTETPPRLMVIELKPDLAAASGASVDEAVQFVTALGYERDRPVSELIGSQRRMPHIDMNVVFRHRSSCT